MPRYFGSRFEVCFQRILFLVVADAFVAAVYINDVECLRMLDDEVCATGQVYRFAKCCLYLFGNAKLVEYGKPVVVLGHTI